MTTGQNSQTYRWLALSVMCTLMWSSSNFKSGVCVLPPEDRLTQVHTYTSHMDILEKKNMKVTGDYLLYK